MKKPFLIDGRIIDLDNVKQVYLQEIRDDLYVVYIECNNDIEVCVSDGLSMVNARFLLDNIYEEMKKCLLS